VKTYSKIHNGMAIIGWITVIYLAGSSILDAVDWFVNTAVPWVQAIFTSTGLAG
jgi:hypothetical protein